MSAIQELDPNKKTWCKNRADSFGMGKKYALALARNNLLRVNNSSTKVLFGTAYLAMYYTYSLICSYIFFPWYYNEVIH